MEGQDSDKSVHRGKTDSHVTVDSANTVCVGHGESRFRNRLIPAGGGTVSPSPSKSLLLVSYYKATSFTSAVVRFCLMSLTCHWSKIASASIFPVAVAVKDAAFPPAAIAAADAVTVFSA